MSEVHNTNTNESDNEAVTELHDKFQKKGKVVALASDNQEEFLNFLEGVKEYQNFTNGAPKSFDGLALVRTEDAQGHEQRNRLISIASMEDAFSDAIVRKAMYRWYVSRVINTATDDEANAAQFVTTAGCFKQKFDLDAFKFQAKVLCKILRDHGLQGITNNALRQSFASQAYAASRFPRMTPEQWGKVMNVAVGMAEKNGFDTSIFDHWKATRDVASADTSTLELGDITAIASEMETALGEKEEAHA